MKNRWILDIGAFRGEDAEFYLLKGFHVVSVEANPAFAAQALERNREAAAEGRYRVVNVAIDERGGEIAFHVHDKGDWSSAIRSDRFSDANSRTITVPAITAKDLFAIYGTPYYVKIDIEGKDGLVLETIAGLAEKPPYVSYELGAGTRGAARSLREAGYARFALSPQGELGALRMTRPPREGKFVDYRFTGHHSGPFGRETPGEWMTDEELQNRLADLDRSQGLARWWDVRARLDGAERLDPTAFSREAFETEPLSRWELPAPAPAPRASRRRSATSARTGSAPSITTTPKRRWTASGSG